MTKYCYHCMTPMDGTAKVCPRCGREEPAEIPAHHLLPGSELHGKFIVGEALGEGGFGITYIGKDKILDMKVAIKEYYPNGYVSRANTVSPKVSAGVTEDRRTFFEKGRERFLQEARLLARFSGEPGIVDVRDFFEENNTAYIIMEYLEGETLKHYLETHGTLTPAYTVRLMTPVMKSLQKVHAEGLIHRDISPDNIMVNGDKVKLLDFGAARTVSAEANKSLSIMLKPGYAPEEQYRGRGNQGPWTDVYALCATMYKCITGVTPDDATQRVFSDEVQTPSALGVKLDPNLENAIMRGMGVHQKDRYQSIEELICGIQGVEAPAAQNDETVTVGKAVSEDEVATVYAPEEEPKPAPPVPQKPEPKPVPKKPEPKPIPAEKKEKKEKKQKKKGAGKVVLIAAAAVVALIAVLWAVSAIREKAAYKKEHQIVSAFVFADEYSPALQTEGETPDLSAIYRDLAYNERMFYGEYTLKPSAIDDNELETYKNNMEYGAMTDEAGQYLTNLPYSFRAGPKSFGSTLQAAETDGDWMELTYCTERGYDANVKARYVVEGNTMTVTPVAAYEQTETGVTCTLDEERTIAYTFAFDGVDLTLTYGSRSVTLQAEGFEQEIVGNVFYDNYYLDTNANLSEGSEAVDGLTRIVLHFGGGKGRETLYDAEGNFIRESVVRMTRDGLFAMTYTDGHEKNTQFFSHRFAFFYCGKDGLILTDGEQVYYYLG